MRDKFERQRRMRDPLDFDVGFGAEAITTKFFALSLSVSSRVRYSAYSPKHHSETHHWRSRCTICRVSMAGAYSHCRISMWRRFRYIFHVVLICSWSTHKSNRNANNSFSPRLFHARQFHVSTSSQRLIASNRLASKTLLCIWVNWIHKILASFLNRSQLKSIVSSKKSFIHAFNFVSRNRIDSIWHCWN